MEDFYKRWIQNFAEKTKTFNEGKGDHESNNQLNQSSSSNIQSPTDIVFENNTLKMVLLRSKKFSDYKTIYLSLKLSPKNQKKIYQFSQTYLIFYMRLLYT